MRSLRYMASEWRLISSPAWLCSVRRFITAASPRQPAWPALAGMTAEMAGHHLRALEARLGVRLLNRTTRKLSMTDAGRAYHARCVAVLDEVALAEAEAGARQVTPRGHLRIAAPLAFGTALLAPAVAAFLDRFTEISIELDLSERQNAEPSVRPRDVNLYSTLGGTKGCTVRTIRPSRSICRRVCVSIFWLTPGIRSPRRVKRSSPASASTSKISIVHLSATRPISSVTSLSMRGSRSVGGVSAAYRLAAAISSGVNCAPHCPPSRQCRKARCSRIQGRIT